MPPVDTWINKLDFKSTAEVKIPERLVDQVIGQERAVEVIRKAAEQKRHVMLIGDPGTGKSMLARSMTELLPRDELQDIIVYHNPEDPNEPKIRVVPAGKGREIVNAQKAEAMQRREQKASMVMTIVFFIIGLSVILSYDWEHGGFRSDAATTILFGILVAAIIYIATRYTGHRQENLMVPKLLVTHSPDEMSPFIDATGSHAGALLGDVKHDPFQSGGLETPAHERVESGSIHKAHKGVLFIDEINVLRMESQQSLLTAMQEKKFSIVGQSERSSGAMVKTEPVPCDFILVAAGNLDAVQGMHPALRSRIRGYGYEIYMKSTMADSEENRLKLVRFVAQEVSKDKKIPHFDKAAVEDLRLIKLDLLSVRGLAAISETKSKLRLRSVPAGDARTYATLRTAKTIGCFQVESPAMMNLLRRMRPEDIFEITQALALVRPGPTESGMQAARLRRRSGRTAADGPGGRGAGGDAFLARILPETGGILLYEEQVMQVAERVAGMPPEEGDLLRRSLKPKGGDAVLRV